MLRVRQRSDQARLLDDRDRAAALAVCAVDPVANVFVESRIRAFGLDPGDSAPRCGARARRQAVSLCYGGANLVPVQATSPAIAAFADRALRQGRRCSSIVGTSAVGQRAVGVPPAVLGPARDVRAAQPLMAIDGPSPIPRTPRSGASASMSPTSCCPPPSPCSPRRSASHRWPATAAPRTGPGRRLVRSGRAFARIEDGQVIFKAEVGAATPQACQVQGVWVRQETGAGASPRQAWPPWSTGPPVDLPAGVALRQRLQHPGPRDLPARRVRRGRRVHVRLVLIRPSVSPGGHPARAPPGVSLRQLVPVADEPEFSGRSVGFGQGRELRGLELVHEVLADAGHVGRRHLPDRGQAVGREHANVPRLSPSQPSRVTRPLVSIRLIWCESLLRDCAVRSASSVIRIRLRGASESSTRIS